MSSRGRSGRLAALLVPEAARVTALELRWAAPGELGEANTSDGGFADATAMRETGVREATLLRDAPFPWSEERTIPSGPADFLRRPAMESTNG